MPEQPPDPRHYDMRIPPASDNDSKPDNETADKDESAGRAANKVPGMHDDLKRPPQKPE